MAINHLPAPGKKISDGPFAGEQVGPCLEENCEHSDCETTRQMAASICRFCGEAIGYETAFTGDPEPDNPFGICHFRCLDEHLEGSR